jgi:hypothetical protein
VAKTREQRRQYVDTVVRGQDSSSTAPTALGDEDAATDIPAAREDRARSTRPSRRSSRAEGGAWLREHARAIVTVAVTAAAAFVGWVTIEIVQLNREMGKLQQSSQETARRLEEIQRSAIRSEDRLEGEMRTLRERVDGRPAQK